MSEGGDNTLAYFVGGLIVALGLLAFIFYDGPADLNYDIVVCPPQHILIDGRNIKAGVPVCVPYVEPTKRDRR